MLWDLATDTHCGTLVKSILTVGKTIALIGHSLPCALQDELIRLGANYSKAQDALSHVVQDDALTTAQNAASALDAAHQMLKALRR